MGGEVPVLQFVVPPPPAPLAAPGGRAYKVKGCYPPDVYPGRPPAGVPLSHRLMTPQNAQNRELSPFR